MEPEEVPFRPSRQSAFTAAQRWALLEEYDQCLDRGAKAAFCRRVGISAFTMNSWIRKRAEGLLVEPAAVVVSESGRRAALNFAERQELERLRRDNERLKQRLEQSEAAADILGKAAAFLEGLAKGADHKSQPPEPPPVPGRPAWLADPDTSSLPSLPPRNSKGSE